MDSAAKWPAVLIAGPTASGKSALEVALAERLNGVVINADSMQVYRELRVLTARPDDVALARVPHRLYGELSAAERCSAGRWLEMALAAVASARGAGRLPILVGGTGLYFRALLDGLAPVPPIPPEAVRSADDAYDAVGGESFRWALTRDDPAALSLLPSDRQRLVRLFAVRAATGRTLADWQGDAVGPRLSGSTIRVALLPERAALHARIDARVPTMVADGALDEVRALMAFGLDPSLPAMKAVGVRPFAAHLAGRLSLDDAVAQTRAATRQYAKRQFTWIRHQMVAWRRLDAQDSQKLVESIFSIVKESGLTTQQS